MHIETEVKLGFKNVLIKPKHSTVNSRSKVDLNREYIFKYSGAAWQGVPVIAANMDTIGTFSMANALFKSGLITAIHKHYDIEDWRKFLQAMPPDIYDHIALSCGILQRDYDYLSDIISAFPELKFICIDVANGYTEDFTKYVRKVRKHFKDKTIIAGNVVTAEMTEKLILAGADIIKVGIGPGSVCTTRVKTGVGYPQLSAIIECADAAHGLKGHIIADGGCTCSGDLAKAFGAGADFVMLGGMLAGHDECEGKIISINNSKYMKFYGMSSSFAMDKYHEGVAKYRTSEGKVINVPYRGPIDATIQDILGGLRSACTYVGASKLKELARRTTFIMVKEQENVVFS